MAPAPPNFREHGYATEAAREAFSPPRGADFAGSSQRRTGATSYLKLSRPGGYDEPKMDDGPLRHRVSVVRPGAVGYRSA